MKSFKISSFLQQEIEEILQTKKMEYLIQDDMINIDLSGRQFHKIVRQADCLREEKMLHTQVFLYEELGKKRNGFLYSKDNWKLEKDLVF